MEVKAKLVETIRVGLAQQGSNLVAAISMRGNKTVNDADSPF